MSLAFIAGAVKEILAADRSGSLPLYPALAALFLATLVGVMRVRVQLHGDSLSYRRPFARTHMLHLDEIRSAAMMARSGYLDMFHYLVIEPADEQQSPLRIRTDYFSNADARMIRDFLGDKLLKQRPSHPSRANPRGPDVNVPDGTRGRGRIP
jgi:hypothetical protein